MATRTDRWWSGKVLEMPTDECWELLDARMVGRLAWQEDDGAGDRAGELRRG